MDTDIRETPRLGGVIRQLRASRVGFYPLIALGLLGLSDELQPRALGVLRPQIGHELGLPMSFFNGLDAVGTAAGLVGALAVAALVQRRARRASVAIVTGLLWSVLTAATGLVGGAVGLLLSVGLDSVTTSSVQVVHPTLLVDSYPAAIRARVISLYRLSGVLAGMVAPVLVAVLIGPAHLGWRGVFIAGGAISMVLTMSAVGLRDPGFGGRSITAAPPRRLGAAVRTFVVRSVDLLRISTVRRIVLGFSLWQMWTKPVTTFVQFLFQDSRHVSPAVMALMVGLAQVGPLVGLLLVGRVNDRLLQSRPARIPVLVGAILILAPALIAGILVLPTGPGLVAFALTGLVIVLVAPGYTALQLSVTPAPLRTHSQALTVVGVVVGTVAGALLGVVVSPLGTVTGTLLALIPAVLGALWTMTAARSCLADMRAAARQEEAR